MEHVISIVVLISQLLLLYLLWDFISRYNSLADCARKYQAASEALINSLRETLIATKKELDRYQKQEQLNKENNDDHAV